MEKENTHKSNKSFVALDESHDICPRCKGLCIFSPDFLTISNGRNNRKYLTKKFFEFEFELLQSCIKREDLKLPEDVEPELVDYLNCYSLITSECWKKIRKIHKETSLKANSHAFQNLKPVLSYKRRGEKTASQRNGGVNRRERNERIHLHYISELA